MFCKLAGIERMALVGVQGQSWTKYCGQILEIRKLGFSVKFIRGL